MAEGKRTSKEPDESAAAAKNAGRAGGESLYTVVALCWSRRSSMNGCISVVRGPESQQSRVIARRRRRNSSDSCASVAPTRLLARLVLAAFAVPVRSHAFLPPTTGDGGCRADEVVGRRVLIRRIVVSVVPLLWERSIHRQPVCVRERATRLRTVAVLVSEVLLLGARVDVVLVHKQRGVVVFDQVLHSGAAQNRFSVSCSPVHAASTRSQLPDPPQSAQTANVPTPFSVQRHSRRTRCERGTRVPIVDVVNKVVVAVVGGEGWSWLERRLCGRWSGGRSMQL